MGPEGGSNSELWTGCGKQTGAFTNGVSSDKKQPEAAGQEGDAGEGHSYRLAGLRLHPALPCNMIRSKRCPSPQPHQGGAS